MYYYNKCDRVINSILQYASWDTAFQMIPYARVDPGFAQSQMELLLSERYMHPNGQVLHCFEWSFSQSD